MRIPGGHPVKVGGHPPSQLGDLGAVAGPAVGIQRGPPGLLGQRRQRVLDGLAG